MKIKTVFNLFVTLSLLALGPKDNRNLLFRTPPDHSYGEILIYHDGQSQWSIAKNSGNNTVEIPKDHMTDVYTRDFNDGAQYFAKNEVKANSVALIKRVEAQKPQDVAEVLVDFGNRTPKPPSGLQIATEADIFYMFIWPVVLLGLAVGLTFLINDYSWQCKSPLRDLAGPDE